MRPGGIPSEDIERLLDVGLAPAGGPSRAPGMLAAHYSPAATVVLADDRRHAEELIAEFEADGLRVRVLDFGDDLVGYARSLYQSLRDADAAGADRVVAVLPPPRGLGHAIRDRLQKAAAGRLTIRGFRCTGEGFVRDGPGARNPRMLLSRGGRAG